MEDFDYYKDFAAIILTHKRANKVYTYSTLRKQGYTGKILLLIDDEDPQMNEYLKRYPNEVRIFHKDDYADKFDMQDNLEGKNVVVYARNAVWDIAEREGLKYFLELDDDYMGFRFVWVENGEMMHLYTDELDEVFKAMIQFLEDTNALTVAFGQGGDLIGGAESQRIKEHLGRKAMNAFFCKTSRRFKFMGRLNEDTNMYVYYGVRGQLIFTVYDFILDQVRTQAQSGGLTEAYLDLGTYVKSFYTVMLYPAGVSIRMMGPKHQRFHHHIDWDKCVPCILSEEVKYGAQNET